MIYEELSIDNELFGDLTNIAYLLSEDFFQRTCEEVQDIFVRNFFFRN